MKRGLLLLLLAMALSFTFLTSCAEPVVPVAYTRFDTSEVVTIYYTSHMYYDQIEVYEDESLVMSFTFNCCHGRDELEGKAYTLVDVTRKPDLSVSIYDPFYSGSKKIYLNGVALIPNYDSGTGVMSFTDIDSFIRTNPNGKIDPEKVNVIEYR